MMNHYIERYIADVVRRLPENQRKDVSLELNSLIEDMLEETDDVKTVLQTLGNPKDLASKYREKPRYLISPDIFDQYIDTLKLVVRIVLIVSSVIAGIVIVSDVIGAPLHTMDTQSLIVFIITRIFANLSVIISMSVTAIVGVTLVYAILEAHGPDLSHKEWSVDDLPPLEKENMKRISKGEVITEIVMTLFFVSILLAMVLNDMNIPLIIDGTIETYVFNLEVLHQYALLITLSASLDILSSVLKLAFDRYNFVVAISTLISNAFAMVVAVIVLLNSNLITPEFSQFLKTILPVQGISLTFAIIFAILCVISIYDIGSTFYYTIKNNRLTSKR
ncbi:hypothetical protein AOC36_11665 (plasmid) [Erysipelothrix larvae]|uniref:Uncharacterized protein n=1 Tax=Erysipelothrix larvae TaxID=1514105 RepID=A0A0X8H0J2_9FIRM|nr:hypothetical protein [Erysipelothrix larvae]AMC93769.1 hypothetical protein AOC36_07160 [Erysipelothrix larvae]AMC94687.1 hypothetical protein AOC36_11665 [Erysipelothrix larvae]